MTVRVRVTVKLLRACARPHREVRPTRCRNQQSKFASPNIRSFPLPFTKHTKLPRRPRPVVPPTACRYQSCRPCAKMPADVIDEKRAHLQKVNDAGVSVYAHITEVFARILTAQPENALDALESVSLEAKAGYFDAASTLAPAEPSSDLEIPSEWHVGTSALLTVRG